MCKPPNPSGFCHQFPLRHIYMSRQENSQAFEILDHMIVSCIVEVMGLYSHIFVLTSIASEKFPEPAFVKAATRIEYNVSNSNPERTAIFLE